MDQSMNMEHNYGVPFIPGHLYLKNNSKVVHHVPLGCLLSLIHLRPRRLVEGRELTRQSSQGTSRNPKKNSVSSKRGGEEDGWTYYICFLQAYLRFILTSPTNVQHLLFSSNLAKTPPRTENTSILVKDTPEKDYGLRVTWRRRKELMKLLIDRGQLLLSDAEVANE
ncbi:RAD9, HUS1, RAD1-interacting nuclear protein [Pimephales promelas]|nr:RAD9, HUS1, RAD1-interacting nuclear protein [Pimephales promelas]